MKFFGNSKRERTEQGDTSSRKSVKVSRNDSPRSREGYERPKLGAIVISNLADYVTEGELKDLFKEFGDIKHIKIPRERSKVQTGRQMTLSEYREACARRGSSQFKPSEERDVWVGKGVAYITFWDEKDADAALSLDGIFYEHARISVRITQPQSQRQKTNRYNR